jgi:hypothetical protein
MLKFDIKLELSETQRVIWDDDGEASFFDDDINDGCFNLSRKDIPDLIKWLQTRYDETEQGCP